MQINFHSLLWSYLPRVAIFLAMTVNNNNNNNKKNNNSGFFFTSFLLYLL